MDSVRRWAFSYFRSKPNPIINTIFFSSKKGNVSNANTGFVAIDDVALLNGRCPAAKFCDFESYDICGYTYDGTADVYWERNQASTSSLFTGPSFDHTYQTNRGHYMFVEASDALYGNKIK
jgi:hypothetical protein